MIMENMKKCYKCGGLYERSNENFGKDSSRYDGFRPMCKGCDKIRMKEYDARPSRKAKRANRPMTISRRLSLSRKVARSRNLEWEIDLKSYEILMNKMCHYCGLEILPTGIGLDRIDNNAGYKISNVVACCAECNTARMDNFTHEEFIKFIGPAIRLLKLSRVSISKDGVSQNIPNEREVSPAFAYRRLQ